MQFRIFKSKNVIQGVSDAAFGSMVGKKGDKKAIKFLKSLGYKINIKNLIWAEQVFGPDIHICQDKDAGKTIKAVDGLISNIKGQILVVISADCVPVLLFDPRNEAAAVLHGSRKSLIKGIVKKAIMKMVLNFNSNPKEILVGIGPHIRKCHYYVDLTRIAIDDLLKSGIKRKNIEDCKICTFCSPQKYFSHRKEQEIPGFYKEKRSRFASFIGLSRKSTVIEILDRGSRSFNSIIKTAVDSIKKGRVLVCPTDTVYGLIADATNKKAVDKVFKIKKRPRGKPVPIFVKDIAMARKLAKIDKKQEEFLKKAWPGKITAVLKRKAQNSKRKTVTQNLKLYGVDKKLIALRIPNYKLLLRLTEQLNRPLTGTSANISGQPASGKIKAILKQFKEQKYQPDLIFNAGDLPKSKPSKVIDLTVSPPKILRF